MIAFFASLLQGAAFKWIGAHWKVIWPVLLAILVIASYGIWHHHVYANGAKSEGAIWQARWDKRDRDEKAALDAETARRKAEAAATAAHNQEIENALNDKAAEAAAYQHDLATARRLLAAAAKPPGSTGASVPEAGSQPGPTSSGAPGSDAGTGHLLELVTAAIGECRRNADEWDGLWKELTPQLSPQ